MVLQSITDVSATEVTVYYVLNSDDIIQTLQ